MDEKVRFRRFVVAIAAVLVGGAIPVVVTGAVGTDSWAAVMPAVFLVAMALVAIVVVRKELRELKSGLPMEDERSKAIEMRAGYLAFFVSIYLMIGTGSVLVALEDNQVSSLSTSEWFMFYVAIMGSIFLAANAYLNKKGVPR